MIKRILSNISIAIGVILILSSIYLIINNEENDKYANDESMSILDYIENNTNNESLVYNDNEDSKSIEVKGSNYIGTIYIPALNIKLPINEKFTYNNLRKTPCRYYGSIETNDLVICAHSYSSHFKNIGLLSSGDIIIITDAYNNSYKYQVELTEVLESDDIDSMLESDYDLTLYTCNSSGLERITVRCMRIYD